MRIAYLIMAHDNYIHLQRLINALDGDHCRFYIHIDKKSKMPALKGQNIIFTKERVRVYWSSFSEVTATLNLLRMAIKDRDNDYFVLLSGVDYPVKSNSLIVERLSQNGEFLYMTKATSHVLYKYYYLNGFNRNEKSIKGLVYLRVENFLKKLKIRKKIPF